MPTDDEQQIKLLLHLTDSGTIDEAIAKLTRLKKATQGAADTYDVAEKQLHQYSVSLSTADIAMDKYVDAAVEATMRQKALNQVMEESTVKGGKFNAFMGEHKFRILEAGRAVQDFAQGGIAGILNNIERLVGGTGAAAGIITAVGVAAYIAWPYIKKWGEEMGAAGEKFDIPLKGTEALTAAIQKNKKALDELREKTTLTYFELLEFAKRTNEVAKAEDQLQRERDARAVKAGSSKKEQERAAAVREAIAESFGSGDEMIESALLTDEGGQLGKKRIEELLVGAQKGFPNETQALRRMLPKFNEAFTPLSPEAKEQRNLAQENFKRENEALAKRQKDKDRGDDLWARAEQERLRELEHGEDASERQDEHAEKAVDAFEKDADRIIKRAGMKNARDAQKLSRQQQQRAGVELERFIDDTIEQARQNGANAEQMMMLMQQAKQMRRQHQDQVFRNQQVMAGSSLDF